jgi:hypothetical protein
VILVAALLSSDHPVGLATVAVPHSSDKRAAAGQNLVPKSKFFSKDPFRTKNTFWQGFRRNEYNQLV